MTSILNVFICESPAGYISYLICPNCHPHVLYIVMQSVHVMNNIGITKFSQKRDRQFKTVTINATNLNIVLVIWTLPSSTYVMFLFFLNVLYQC